MPATETETIPDTQAPIPAPPPSPRRVVDEPRTLPEIVAGIHRHLALAILSFAVVLLAGLTVAYFKGKPQYAAGALIFVSPKFVANLQDDKEFDLQSNSQYREYVQQNVRTINRFDIVREALEHLGSKGDWFKRNETLMHATERLQGALVIEPIPDTYQILVSLQRGQAEGLADIVNSVVDTFLQKIKSEQFYGSDERLKNLREDRDKVSSEIAAKQHQRALLAEKLGVSTFSDGFPNPYDRLLVDGKTALADARRQEIQAEAQLASLSGPQGAQGMAPLEAYALEITNKDPGFVTLHANLNQRRIALLSDISGLTADHPGRRAMERELRELKEEETRVSTNLVNSYEAIIAQQRRAEVAKASKVVIGFKKEVDGQASQAAEFSSGYQHAMGLGLDMDRERKRLDSIDDRINFLSLESRAPGFVRLFSAARTPDAPIKGGRLKYALLACLLASLLGLLIPIGVDFIDPRIHWPGDVRQVLSFPVLGWMMEKKDAGKSFEGEQVMRIASRLTQEHEVHQSRVFAFTGVRACNGTTTIVNEVALALSRSGMSCLTVEANAYRADPRYRSPNSRGLTVVLRGLSDIASEIVPGSTEEGDRLPVGDVDAFDTLPDLQNFVEVLKQARSVYAMILVDLPPILASVDAELIARFSDVVCLVIEAETVTKADVRRAARVLERIQASAVSAILNRVQIDAAANFARRARDEFYNGTTKPASYWASPWLWK